ncbi:MAG: IS200/IS605 family transposase [Ignavibacteria bacterium]|nr:IS200/IS605 family transposase [Ignavibacteria bacterium]
MSFVRVWIHAVWGTKSRSNILKKEIRNELFSHIKLNAKEKGIFVDTVDGYTDHVHCLFTLNADISLSKSLQLIKGEASFWSNKIDLVKPKLMWADEYFAVSVSESVVDKVRKYIRNQEEHHKKMTFQEEYEDFLKKFNLKSQG